MMVNSKIGAKKYFLPLYLTWAIVTPTIVSFMAGYLNTAEGQSVFEAIPWGRVPSFFALFGMVWPLTIVISPAFFASVKANTGLSFFEAFGAANGGEAILGYVLFGIAWIGPFVSTIVVFIRHKNEVALQAKNPEEFGWIDYLAAFV